jgi:hypothetical protein
MTHRVFSRNASSSRAVPVKRMIEDVMADPAVPLFWGKNQKGMQAAEGDHNFAVRLLDAETEEFSDPTDDDRDRLGTRVTRTLYSYSREEAWLRARDNAVEVARAFAEAGYHKQIVNRLLEPFSHINVVVTATEWDNFFLLRRHEAAEPHLHRLADEIFAQLASHHPDELRPGEWHLPYVSPSELSTYHDGLTDLSTLIKLSTARCARVSYLTHDGAAPSVGDDLALYDRLVGSVPRHSSPAEHQATPDRLDKIRQGEGNDHLVWRNPQLHGNFVGWCQHRKMLEFS